jgi:hypothetical protein
MKEAQKKAQQKLEEAKKNWEFKSEEKEIKKLEKLLDEF